MQIDRTALAMARAWLFGIGPRTDLPGGLVAFIKTDPSLAAPDIEFMFRAGAPNASMWMPPFVKPFGDSFAIRPALFRPRSRSKVLVRSAAPWQSRASTTASSANPR